MQEPDALNEAAMLWSAHRGYRTYQQTGDVRTAVRVGTDSYGAYWLIGGGICWSIVFILIALVAPAALLGLCISLPALGWGISLASKTTERYRGIRSGAIHRVPPPIPGDSVAPITSSGTTARTIRSSQRAITRGPASGI